ncbi:MAG TPA: PBP1A family penicillin-binding protein [Longimicrobiales bacterium]
MLAALLAFLAVSAGIGWLLWERCGLRGCPDVERLNGYVPDEASVVVDRRGREIAKLYRIHRVVVPLDSLPPYVPAAFIAVEDRRFWEHDGVDWPRVFGAAWANVRAMGIEEGFSTITMQLARSVFPERLPLRERTLSRKLAEMRVAKEIEERFTKREILELYLNQIYFGGGAWGIEAAAQEYFGKPAAELTLAEAALLAGLIRAPNRLSPRVNPRAALARRAVVLRMMAVQELVPAAEAEAAAREPLELARGTVDRRGRAPYFVEEVRRVVEEKFGDAAYTEGYTIHTTLDLAVQDAAESELAAQLQAIESGHHGAFRHPAFAAGAGAGDGSGRTPYLQGAVVVLDARRGDVLALVGGRSFEDSKFNRATQARRQPGSAFKPIVYAAALAAGLPPTHVLSDAPLRRVLDDGSVWAPRNFGGAYGGAITLRDALVHSRNVATIRLADQIGLDAVIEMANRLGLNGPLPRVPSIAIGAGEVSLLRLVAAYAAFATLGDRPEPRFVTRVEDRDGRVVWRNPPFSRHVLDPGVAFLATDLMRDVVDRGTGTAVRAVGFRGPAAGKTGTTNDGTDVWFIGFTPERVAGVWIGLDRPQPIVPGATGGRLAAPVWGRIMRRTAPRTAAGWVPPPGVEAHLVDAFGHVLPPWCAPYGAVHEEYFLAGTAPPASCAPGGRPFWSDSGAPKLLGEPTDPSDSAYDAWWDRMRRRPPGAEWDTIAGGRPPGAASRPDSPPAGRREDARRRDTPAPGGDGRRDGRPPGARRDGPPRPEPSRGRARRDDGPPKLLGRPARPDTIRR